MGRLDGKGALIAGAGGVIGADTAGLFAEERGVSRGLTDLSTSRIDDVVSDLKDAGHEAVALVGDIVSEELAESLVSLAMSTYGRLDILDNNAGPTHLSAQDGELVDTTRELWETSTSINVTAPMLLCKHAIPAMINGGGGSVVNISSGQSLRGDIRSTAYAAGKGALNALTRHIAVQYGPQGVRCNAICSRADRRRGPAPVVPRTG